MLDSNTTTSTDAGFQSTGSLQLKFFGMYWHCPCKVWHPSNQKCTFSSNFKTFKHLGPSLCFKQLFHLNVKWSKCEHIESIKQGESIEGIEPMPLQHSHLHHLPPANHNLKKSSNRRKQKVPAFLSKLPLNMKLNTTTYNKAAPRRKASFAIFYLLSPHGKGFHASLQKAEGRGLQSRHATTNLTSTFDLVLLITKREFPRNGVAPGWWNQLRWTVGSTKSHITCWGEGLRNRTCSLSFYDILCTMDARYNILEKDGKGS